MDGTRVWWPSGRSAGIRVCYRCGIDFDASKTKLVEGAPCRDCREVLHADGDTTSWDKRSQVAA